MDTQSTNINEGIGVMAIYFDGCVKYGISSESNKMEREREGEKREDDGGETRTRRKRTKMKKNKKQNGDEL